MGSRGERCGKRQQHTAAPAEDGASGTAGCPFARPADALRPTSFGTGPVAGGPCDTVSGTCTEPTSSGVSLTQHAPTLPHATARSTIQDDERTTQIARESGSEGERCVQSENQSESDGWCSSSFPNAEQTGEGKSALCMLYEAAKKEQGTAVPRVPMWSPTIVLTKLAGV